MAGSAKAAKGHLPAVTEHEAREALTTLEPMWDELFPAEQARMREVAKPVIDKFAAQYEPSIVKLYNDELARVRK